MSIKVFDKLSSWKDISQASAYNNKLNKFSNYLKQYSTCDFLPFFLFTDSLPDKERMNDILRDLHSIKNANAQYVLVVQKNVRINLSELWNGNTNGLYDVIEWTGEDELIEYANALAQRNKQIVEILNSQVVKNNLVGESNTWKTFLRSIIEVALFSQVSVLLIGQSGTGKELLSRLIHTLDTRQNKKDLILVDCTTIVPELSGSEFFGHEKGSYTNAIQSREGAFALANEGTLFLDEVGEMPMHLQSELLRVIQEGNYKKIGSNAWRTTKFRLVCATNKDLRSEVNNSKFRQDLYFRIADFEFRVPCLNERIEDIPLLANHFMKEFFSGKECPDFDDSVMEYLVKREYPGNIRELRQLVHRIVIKHVRHKKITMGEIPIQDRCNFSDRAAISYADSFRESLHKAILSGCNLWELKNMTMEEAIQIALQLCNGNKELAARKLGVTWRAILQFWKKNKNE